jgi:hypothetical protein
MATTTPNYGWPVPTSTDYVKDGATAIEALGDAIDATVFGLGSAGLTLIKSQTIGTAVSSVNVTSAFSSTYDNYRIIVSGGTASTNTFGRLQLGSTTTGYYSSLVYAAYDSPTAVNNANNNNGANFNYAGYGNTNGIMFNIDLISPNLAKNTFFASRYVESNTSGSIATGAGNGFVNNTTQYTDFTLSPNSGTYTGGTIKVYGFKN